MANPSKEKTASLAFPHLGAGGLGKALAASAFLGTGSTGCLAGAEPRPAGRNSSPLSASPSSEFL